MPADRFRSDPGAETWWMTAILPGFDVRVPESAPDVPHEASRHLAEAVCADLGPLVEAASAYLVRVVRPDVLSVSDAPDIVAVACEARDAEHARIDLALHWDAPTGPHGMLWTVRFVRHETRGDAVVGFDLRPWA